MSRTIFCDACGRDCTGNYQRWSCVETSDVCRPQGAPYALDLCRTSSAAIGCADQLPGALKFIAQEVRP